MLPKIAGRVPPDLAAARITRLAAWSLLASLPLLLAWATVQTAALADTADLRAVAGSLPTVLGGTAFGHVWLAQVAAVLISLAVLRRRAAVPVTAAAMILHAGHSHALSMEGGPSALLASDVVHLLAAGAWLGGLLPLLLTVNALPPLGGALAARWFSPLGKFCVGAMAVTALYQGWELIATLPGLVGTRYGWVALGKVGLFGVLCAFAAVNRYRFAPALLRGDPAVARRTLVRSVAVQTGFGLVVVVAAGVLSNLPPALHEQPNWPFALQPSLVTVDEDGELKRMVVVALLQLGGAGLLLGLSLALRRFRIVAAVVAAGVAWFAVPTLRLLFVPAYPTSFYRSPTAFAATSIVRGAALYAENCVVCHGASGRGGGPAASLAIPPADLTQAHVWAHPDGELFWWLTHGIEAPEGGLAMPGFAAKLDPDERWALIDFVRANNAGAARRAGEAWPVPIAAPDFAATCPAGRTETLTDLRGHPVRLVFPGGSPPAPLDAPGLVTITVTPTGSGCVAPDSAVPAAYAAVLGQSASSLAGSDLLIDPNGWIRDAQPGTALSAFVRDISAHPLAAVAGGHRHEH